MVKDDIAALTASNRWWFHAVAFALVCWFAIPYFTQTQPWTMLDYANLPFHEAGHYILMPFFGRFIVQLGGTLGQLFVPLAFAIYFGWRRDWFPMWLTLFWLGQNLVNVSIYMRDAKLMLLPLFGGGEDGEGHDWNYLFGQMKLLHESGVIADRTRVLATLLMLVGLGGAAGCLVRFRPASRIP